MWEKIKKIIEWIKNLFKKEPNVVKEFPDGLTWLHTNVSGWDKTATLNIQQRGHVIDLVYDKAHTWTTKTISGTKMNANPWVIVKWSDGRYYAATWESLRPGQTQKNMTGKSWGGHIKVSPLNKWEPKKGEEIGMFVSGLARTPVRNQLERSNVIWFNWS